MLTLTLSENKELTGATEGEELYERAYRSAKGKRWVNHSPLVRSLRASKKVFIRVRKSIWPLYIEESERWRTLSSGGPSGPLLLEDHGCLEVVRHLERAGRELGADRIQVQLTPSFISDQSVLRESLVASGFHEIPLATTTVHLTTESEVKKRMRGNFRRYWNKTERVQVLESPSERLLERMYSAAEENFRRTSLPLEDFKTFRGYGELIKRGEGVLFHYKKGADDAFLLVRVIDRAAYFLFGCSTDGLLKDHPHERLHCRAIQYLLNRGYDYYDVGLVPISSWRKKLQAKERSLAHFKQGLGGKLYSISIFEKSLTLRFRAFLILKKMISAAFGR